MNIKNMLKGFVDFVARDTKARNESKKTIVVIRILLLSITLYFGANIVIGKAARDIWNLLFYFALILSFAGMFAATYYFRTRPITIIFNVAMVLFIVIVLLLFGWNVGVQHFIMVLLLLAFFSQYHKHKQKFIYAIALCGFRLVLFFIFYGRTPYVQISKSANATLQVINTVTIFWCLSVIAYVYSKDGQELESKLVEYNSQLEQQANTDKLTGLPNRRRGWDYLESLSTIGHQREFCLCICDIDWFKKVNDTYGHDIGDEVLKAIAGIFAEEMQGDDMATRWGGEEFLLVFPNCNGDHTYEKLEHIRSRIKSLRVPSEKGEVAVTMTFGLAEYDYEDGFEALLKEADSKLYRGKEAGRDRIVY